MRLIPILIGIFAAIPIVNAQTPALGLAVIDTIVLLLIAVFIFLGVKKLLQMIK